MENGWHVSVGSDDYDMGARIYIWRVRDGVRELLQFGTPNLVKVSFDGTAPEPSLYFDGFNQFEIPRKLVEAFAKRGIRPDNDARLEGILEATKAHLEDMRLLAGVKPELLPKP